MKKLTILMSILLCLSLLSGCGDSNYAKEAPTEQPSKADEVSTEPEVDDAWKEIMTDYLRNVSVPSENDGYLLIYLDNDDIPELVEIGNCAASGCRIINIYDGIANLTQLRRLDFNYIERSGLLRNTDGNMGYYTDDVYRLQDGVMERISEGTIEVPESFDSEGNVSYEYHFTLNGESVADEAAYTEAMAKVYDDKIAKTYSLWPAVPYSADEIIDRLGGKAPADEALNAYREVLAGERSFNLDNETMTFSEFVNPDKGAFLSPAGFGFADMDENGAVKELILKFEDFSSTPSAEKYLVLTWCNDSIEAHMENPENLSGIALNDFLNENIQNLIQFYS